MTHLERYFAEKKEALKIPGTQFWLDIRRNKKDHSKIDLMLLNPFGTEEHQMLTNLPLEMAGSVLDSLFAPKFQVPERPEAPKGFQQFILN